MCWWRRSGFRASSFQAEQLPREYLALVLGAGPRTPLLLVVLGSPPPVRLAGHAGRIALQEAVTLHLGTVYNRVDGVPLDLDEMTRRLPDTLAWITWSEIQQTVVRQAEKFADLDQELAGTIRRLSASVTAAIDWHA